MKINYKDLDLTVIKNGEYFGKIYEIAGYSDKTTFYIGYINKVIVIENDKIKHKNMKISNEYYDVNISARVFYYESDKYYILLVSQKEKLTERDELISKILINFKDN